MPEGNDRRNRREPVRGRSRKRPVSRKRRTRRGILFLMAALLTLVCAAVLCAVLWTGCPSREEETSPGMFIQEETFPDDPAGSGLSCGERKKSISA